MTVATMMAIVAIFFILDFWIYHGNGSRMVLETIDQFSKLFEHGDTIHSEDSGNSDKNAEE